MLCSTGRGGGGRGGAERGGAAAVEGGAAVLIGVGGGAGFGDGPGFGARARAAGSGLAMFVFDRAVVAGFSMRVINADSAAEGEVACPGRLL